MSRSPILIATALVLGCYPTPEAEVDAEGLTGSSNRLSDAELELTWWVEDEWEGGACVKMRVQNTGGALDWWDITLKLDADWTTWIGGYGGAPVFPWDSRTVAIMPEEGALDQGGGVEVSYCTEPKAVPSAMTATTKRPDEGSAGGMGDDDYINGSIRSDGFGLTWTDAGESRGGRCLEFTLVNLSGSDLDGWYAEAPLRHATDITDSWGLSAYTFGTNLMTLMPASWDDSSLNDRHAATGTACFDPATEPVGLQVYAETSGEGGGGDGSTGDTLNGELFDPETGWGLRYTDGGYSDGEQCYNIEVVNLSGEDASDWEATLEMDEAVSVTRAWSFSAWGADGASVRLLSQDWNPGLDQGESILGGMCLTPQARPVAAQFDPTP